MNLHPMKRPDRPYRKTLPKPEKKTLMQLLRAYARRCRGTYYTIFNT